MNYTIKCNKLGDIKMEIKCNFDFSKCPELKGMYEKYYKLRLEVVKWSMKDGDTANKRYEKAETELHQYGYTVLAKAVFDTFSKIKPILHKRRGEDGYYKWDEIFDISFEENDENKKKCLIGLIEGKFVYELPLQYYINK